MKFFLSVRRRNVQSIIDYQWKYSKFTLFKRSINEMKKKERNNGRKLGWIYFELVVRWEKFVDERLCTEDLLLDARIELRITKDNLDWLWIASEREFRMTNRDWSVEPRDVEYHLSSIRSHSSFGLHFSLHKQRSMIRGHGLIPFLCERRLKHWKANSHITDHVEKKTSLTLFAPREWSGIKTGTE
jgi:hypothetical protein